MMPANKVPFLYRFLIHPEYRSGRYAVLLLAIAVIAVNITFFNYRENLQRVDYRAYGVAAVLFVAYLSVVGLNLFVLVPRFLLKKKYGLYLGWLAAAVLFTVGLQTFLEYLTYRFWQLPGGRSSYVNWVTMLDLVSGFAMNGICLAGSAMPVVFRHWADGNRRMSEMEQQHLRTQVDQLKEQVDAQLLLSTLHHTGTLAAENAAEASALLMKLSQILRYQLYDCNRNYVSLRSEIRFLNDYLELKQMCSEHPPYRLVATGAVERTVVPPLLFIPFVRYAVEEAGAGHVDITLKAENETVDFVCRYTAAQNAPVSGFRQIRQRLALLYGERFRLSLVPAGQIHLQLNPSDDERL